MEILDLGCGRNKKKEAVGIDIKDYPGVDIVHDLNTLPWPFRDNRFNLVICSHILEHLDNIVKTMDEIHRITKDKAKVIIETPHFSNVGSFTDPTHKWHFTYESFNYFFKNSKREEFGKKKFRLIKRKLIFPSIQVIGKTLSIISVFQYEKFFAYLFPAQDIYLELEVIKESS